MEEERTKPVTIKDVAREAGVSIATVSRLLNGLDGVAPERAQRIRDAVEKLHYQPNSMARALKIRESRSIGLIIPDIENPFFPALVRGVEDAAQLHGYAVILCNTDGKPTREEEYMKFLYQKQVDGILFAGNLDFAENSHWLSTIQLPIVLLDRRIPGAPYSAVLSANEDGAYLAVQHLIAQGCRQIAVIGGRARSPVSNERLQGYRQALIDNKMEADEMLCKEGNFSFEGGYQAMESLLAGGKPFDGLFAANDMMAIGALQCLERHGRKVPEEIAVVGYDDIQMAAWYKPALTTMGQPVYEMGRLAVAKLVEEIGGKNVVRQEQILQPHLVVRQSSLRKGQER
ncbi:LacI family DNA-binding transcriptional regulator [Azotosporobacter soli]|uniref:LacI family DNA-binding transcriptional regulator n=1 Tax=Azotosporobacter soli TaxID=3055040 RepID=UPI0031FEF41F